MIFSAALIFIIFLLVWWKIKTKPKYQVSFLEIGTPENLLPLPQKTKNRYFHHPDGVVDLSKHPEYVRFKEVTGRKEYLVEPWKRDSHLYVDEGKTKAVIYEPLRDQHGNVLAVIPCLRLIETVVNTDKKEGTYLGVCWGEERKMVKSEYLLGIVKYEGF